jgi:hypothetical protein
MIVAAVVKVKVKGLIILLSSQLAISDPSKYSRSILCTEEHPSPLKVPVDPSPCVPERNAAVVELKVGSGRRLFEHGAFDFVLSQTTTANCVARGTQLEFVSGPKTEFRPWPARSRPVLALLN